MYSHIRGGIDRGVVALLSTKFWKGSLSRADTTPSSESIAANFENLDNIVSPGTRNYYYLVSLEARALQKVQIAADVEHNVEMFILSTRGKVQKK